jgi:hypothetical protein
MKRINQKAYRAGRGQMIAEGTAAIVLILPILILTVFVAIEISKAWCIQQALEHACREATKMLAEEYGREGSLNTTTGVAVVPPIVTTRSLQNTDVFTPLVTPPVGIKNIVVSVNQFTNPVWVIPGVGIPTPVAQGTPASVTVQCIYAGGTNGLPKFPDWDPLKLGATFKLAGSSTYYLENQ